MDQPSAELSQPPMVAQASTDQAYQFLARAGASLAAAVDHEQALRTLATLAVPALADFCLVDVLEGGELRRAAVAHVDKAREPLLRRLRPKSSGIGQELAGGRSRLLAGGPALAGEIVDPDDVALAAELDISSALLVPLVARGQALGSLGLFMSAPGRSHGPREQALAHDLAGLAALTLDNTRSRAAHQATSQALAEERAARLQAEALATELRASELRFRTVVDLTRDWEFWIDAEQRFIYVSPSCERISGYPAATFLDDGQFFFSIVHPDDAAAVRHEIETALERQTETELDFRLVTHSGDEAWVAMVCQRILSAGGASLGVRGSIRDVGERKRAESEREAALEALRASAARFKTLFDVLPIGLSILDHERRVVDSNEALDAILQLPKDRILAGDYVRRRYIAADGTPLSAKEFPSDRALNEKRAIHNVEIGVVKEDDEIIWTSVSASPLPLPDLAVVVTTADITARKQAEQERERLVRELAAERQFAQTILDSAPAGIVVLDGQELRVKLCNPAYLTFLEEPYRHAGIDGLRLQEFIPRAEESGVVDVFRQVAASGRPFVAAEFEHVGFERGVTYWRWSLQPLRSDSPAPDLLLLVTEITESVLARRRIEELARQAEQHAAVLETTLTAIPDGLIVYGPDGEIVRMNAPAQSILGYRPEERKLTLGDRLARSRARLADAPRGTGAGKEDLPLVRALRGETVKNVQVAIDHGRTGESTWVVGSTAPIWLPDGTVGGAISSFTDITALRNAQHLLEEANQHLQDQAEELEIQTEELRAQNSELLRVMQQLDEERARLEQVLQQMPAGVLIAEAPSGRIVLGNSRAEHILGRPTSLIASVQALRQLSGFHPDGRRYAPGEWPLARAVHSGEVVVGEEVRLWRDDGSECTLSVSAVPLRSRDGQIVAGLTVLHDVTERKQMEESLRQARDELDLRVRERTEELAEANRTLQFHADLLGTINDAVMAIDLETRITAWNRAAQELYGWTAAEVEGRKAADVVPVTFLSPSRDEVFRSLAETGRAECDLLHTCRDGRQVIVESRSMAIHDEQGRLVGFVAVNRDVTERKRMEEELRYREELFQQFAENVHDVFWVTDVERRRMLYANAAYEKLWGRPRQELYDRPDAFLDDIHPDDRERVVRARATRQPGAFDEQYRVLRADGSLRWVHARAFPIHNPAGEVYRIAGVVEDVTEQVQALQLLEQRVAERTRELSTLLAISQHLAAVLHLEPLLELIVEQLKMVVDHRGLVVYQISESGDELVVAHYRGPLPRDHALRLRTPLHGSIGLEEAVAGRRPVIVSDLQAYAAQQPELSVAAEIQLSLVGSGRSWMCVPIVVKDRVIGVLRLTHDEPDYFTEHHARLALAFANQVGVAMENARLHEQAQELAAVQERQRLARDLHDAVSQTLFSASLIADVLPRMWESDPSTAQASLLDLRQLTRGAMAEMRALLLELRPAALLESDLGHLLIQLGEAFSAKSRISVDVAVEKCGPLPPDVQVALYRIAQEALNNIYKHAAASAVQISLKFQTDADGKPVALSMRVDDDGRGFDVRAVPRARLGLGIMRERARSIGAEFEIASRPGHGTQVKIDWQADYA